MTIIITPTYERPLSYWLEWIKRDYEIITSQIDGVTRLVWYGRGR